MKPRCNHTLHPLQSPADEATYLNMPWAEFFHRTGIR